MEGGEPARLSLLQLSVQSVSAVMGQLHERNGRSSFIAEEAFQVDFHFSDRFAAESGEGGTPASMMLRHAPFLIPFQDRLQVFDAFLAQDKRSVPGLQQTSSGLMFHPVGHQITVNRSQVFEDGFRTLHRLGGKLKGAIKVSYINSQGLAEAGIDGGGLFKDFMMNLCKDAFDPQRGLFKATDDGKLYPNPASHLAADAHLEYFEFLGMVLGKAVYDGILVELPLARFFVSKLKGRSSGLKDLESLDAELYQNLLFLKQYEGSVEDLSLFFSLDTDQYGEAKETELIPGGKDVPVTNENVLRYIHLVAHHRLNLQIRPQSYAFLRGFQTLVDSAWTSMFNEDELQELIAGKEGPINVTDMKSNVIYSGGYTEDHETIKCFWEVVEDMSPDDQRELLQFTTSCSRPPLQGFRHLNPHFCIHKAGEAEQRLPTASTCMNLLKLPAYASSSILRDKLLYSIRSGAGFEMS